MQTTKDFLGNEWTFDCMGCAISDRALAVPGGFALKAGHFCVHQDPLIPLPGFLVIASLRHIQSIADMNENEYKEFSKILRVTQLAIKKSVDVEFLTVVQEENSKHFHLWFFPWSKRLIEKYGKPSLTKIREIMSELKRETINEKEWKELEESIQKIKNNLKI